MNAGLRQQDHLLRLRVERLGHHLGFAAVLNEQGAAREDAVHGVDDLMKTAGCAFFLRKTRDAEVTAPAVLDDGHDLNGEVDFFDVEDYKEKYQRTLNHAQMIATYNFSCLLARTKCSAPCQPPRPEFPTCATPSGGS